MGRAKGGGIHAYACQDYHYRYRLPDGGGDRGPCRCALRQRRRCGGADGGAANRGAAASGVGPRVGPNGTVRSRHYQVPAGFDANVALHPYTSGLGPWPGPRTWQIIVKVPSHYNR